MPGYWISTFENARTVPARLYNRSSATYWWPGLLHTGWC